MNNFEKEFQKITKEFAKTVGGKVAVVVKHIPTEKDFLFNEKETFLPASLLKIPVVLEVLNQISKEKLSFDKKMRIKAKDKVGGTGILAHLSEIELTIKDLCYLTITLSDNTAANILIDLVEMGNINKLLKDLGTKNTKITHKFMLYKGKNSITTAYDMMILLEKIYKKEVPLSDKMINFLKEQKYRFRIPFYLKVETGNKTADLPPPDSVVDDIAIVFDVDSPYIICILTQNVPSRAKTSLAITDFSKKIFSFLIYKFDLFNKLPEVSKIIFPIKEFKVNSYKFRQECVYNGVNWGKHLGDDFNTKANTSVFAIADGKVVLSHIYPGNKEKRNWGGVIIIAHKLNEEIIFSLYGHLGKRAVKENVFVKAGQKIGEVGKSLTPENGWWGDEHLHFAIYKGVFDGEVLPGYSPPGKISEWENPYQFLRKIVRVN